MPSPAFLLRQKIVKYLKMELIKLRIKFDKRKLCLYNQIV